MRATPIAIVCATLLAGCTSGKKSQRPIPDDAGSPSEHKHAPEGVLELQPELLVLRQVLVEESSEQGTLRLPSEEMAKRLGRRLVTSGFLAARDGDVPDDRRARRAEVFLTLSYDWAPEAEVASGALVLAAEARIEFVDGRGEPAPAAAVLMDATVPRGESGAPADAKTGQEALKSLATAATDALADSLVARERLRQAPHAELLSALSIGLSEPDMKIWALQLAAMRNLREAVPAAIESLDAEDENLRSAALSVLVEFREPKAVPALIKHADFTDHDDLRVAIEAVTAIGGEEAIEFLEFVGSGHSNPELREHARSNLEQLRKADAPPP